MGDTQHLWAGPRKSLPENPDWRSQRSKNQQKGLDKPGAQWVVSHSDATGRLSKRPRNSPLDLMMLSKNEEWICRKSRETISGLKSEGEARQQVEKSRRSCFVFDFWEGENWTWGEAYSRRESTKVQKRRKWRERLGSLRRQGRDGIAGRFCFCKRRDTFPLRWKVMAYS